MLLSQSAHSFTLAAVNLTMVGFFGGLFAVPLNALLQQKSGDEEKGRLMATNNFLNMLAIMVRVGARCGCAATSSAMTADRIILLFGVLTLVASIYVLSVVPEFLVRFCLWLLTHTIYRIRIEGQQHVPSRGPALLVCNHLSHVDGALVGACIQRFVRFLVYKPYYEHWAVNPLLQMLRAIPVGGGREAVSAIRTARQELENGHVVCIFAEGRSAAPATSCRSSAASRRSSTASTSRSSRSTSIACGAASSASRAGSSSGSGRRASRIPSPSPFGAPLPASTPAAEVRIALMAVGRRGDDDAARSARSARPPVHRVREASLGIVLHRGLRHAAPLTYGRALAAALLLSRWIRRHTGGQDRDRPAPAGIGRRRAGEHRARRSPGRRP